MLQDFKYLEPRQNYIDRYDLHTIEECLKWYWQIRKGMERDRKKLEAGDPKVDFDHEVHKCCSYIVRAISIERYKSRKETIDKWITEDTLKQDKIDNALPPDDITCHLCNSATKVIDKNLDDHLEGEMRVHFMFECLKCQARQIFYEDGSPWDYKRPRCKKCDVELQNKYESTDDTMTITTYCPNCDFKEVDFSDFKKDRLEAEKEAKRRKQLLAEYREEFCLDDTNGPEAVRSLEGICALVDKWREEDRKMKDPVYQKARRLKKLRVNEVKKLLEDELPKNSYVDLDFDKPEMGRFVAVPFVVQDEKTDREEYDSRQSLKKLINKLLEGTNWRLMSDGISYRVGYLSGRLRCYENEDEMVGVLNKKHE